MVIRLMARCVLCCLLFASSALAEVVWGPAAPIPHLPKGWQGHCYQQPIALANCSIFLQAEGPSRLSIVHYAAGGQLLAWYLPGFPDLVLSRQYGWGMHTPIEKVVGTFFRNAEARAQEYALITTSHVVIRLDQMTPPREITIHLDGLETALGHLKAADARLRQALQHGR